VIGCVAALSQLTPPRALLSLDHDRHAHEHEHHRRHEHHHPTPTPTPTPEPSTVWLEDEAGGYRMSARVVTDPDGDSHEIVMTLRDATGAPVEAIEVEASFGLPEQGIEPVVRPMEWDGEGWTLRTRDLVLPDLWHLSFVALVSDFERVRFTGEVPVEW
jgi:hypothetical protein